MTPIYPPIYTLCDPVTTFPAHPHTRHVVESPIRTLDIPLKKTLLDPLEHSNVPECGQLHPPVSPIRVALCFSINTFDDPVPIVPPRLCGQQSNPKLHIPLSDFPMYVARAMIYSPIFYNVIDFLFAIYYYNFAGRKGGMKRNANNESSQKGTQKSRLQQRN